MTFQITKIYNVSRKSISNSQDGVTLLLSILVLSAIMAIAFSIATILFVEVRVSGDLVRSEPALYASNAITEEALFTIRRGIPRCMSGCSEGDFRYTTSLGKVDLNNPHPIELVYNDPVLQARILPTSNSISNTTNRYALYNPNDINLGSGYSSVRFRYRNTGVSGQVHIYVCQFPAPINYLPTAPPVDCNDISLNNTYMIVRNQGEITQETGLYQDQITPTITLDPDQQQELIIFSSGPTATRWVQIETFSATGTPLGIPFYGERAVDINANNSGVTRSLRVIVPGY